MEDVGEVGFMFSWKGAKALGQKNFSAVYEV
jgi:hypothetical protein